MYRGSASRRALVPGIRWLPLTPPKKRRAVPLAPMVVEKQRAHRKRKRKLQRRARRITRLHRK